MILMIQTLHQKKEEESVSNESCEIINSHFANVGQRLHERFVGDINGVYQNVYNIDMCDNFAEFVEEDVVKIVKDIDVHKSLGIDFFPTFILKDCFEIICFQLT